MLTRLAPAVIAAALVAASITTPVAAAPPGLAPLVGSWVGNGSIVLDSGQSENVRCKALYTDKGAGVGVALRCASAASKIDLRANLATAGQKVSGTWEERQFNAAGALAGALSGNRLALDMEGGGLRAAVVVATTGPSQTLSIKADTGGFRSVTVAFAKE